MHVFLTFVFSQMTWITSLASALCASLWLVTWSTRLAPHDAKTYTSPLLWICTLVLPPLVSVFLLLSHGHAKIHLHFLENAVPIFLVTSEAVPICLPLAPLPSVFATFGLWHVSAMPESTDRIAPTPFETTVATDVALLAVLCKSVVR